MSVHSSGIVLLPLLRWHDRAIVLDKVHGKYTVIARNYRFMAGSLLSYQASIGRGYCDRLFLSQVTCLAAPFGTDQSTLGYIHLLLELVHASVPMGAHAAELYTLLSFALSDNRCSQFSSHARIVLLLQLCVLCGFYPELQVCDQQDIYQLLNTPLADVKSIVLNQTVKISLLRWIQDCITSQMGLSNLKTLGYLPMERAE